MMIFEGVQAPFLISWFGVWVFALLGGLASGFIKIEDIDKRLRYPLFAKPLIGMVSGVAMVTYLNGNVEPPPSDLVFWAFVASLCATPIISGFLVFISDQKRQNEFYESAKSRIFHHHDKGGHDKKGGDV